MSDALKHYYLQQMGINRWTVRKTIPKSSETALSVISSVIPNNEKDLQKLDTSSNQAVLRDAPKERPSVFPSTQTWGEDVRRADEGQSVQSSIPLFVNRDRVTPDDSAENKLSKLNQLESLVVGCIRCPLHEARTQIVFSRGNPNAKIMIIGDAPGFDEDQEGVPFVGRTGNLLNQMLCSVGLSEEHVYIANVLKCQPPTHRDPSNAEIELCRDYINQQIQIVMPKLILAVGHLAGQFLLSSTHSLAQLRNTIHNYEGVPVIVTYHPGYLLNNLHDKKNAYQDLLFVQREIKQGSFR